MGHQDFQHSLDGGITLQFFWAPYPANLTALLHQLGQEQPGAPQGRQRRRLQAQNAQRRSQRQRTRLREEEAQAAQQQQAGQQQERGQGPLTAAAAASANKEQHVAPAMVVLSTTLWHLLHFTAPQDFCSQLEGLQAAAAAYTVQASEAAAAGGGKAGGKSEAKAGGKAGGKAGRTAGGKPASDGLSQPRLVLASGTETFPNRMPTEVKRQHMTPANLDSYNQALTAVCAWCRHWLAD